MRTNGLVELKVCQEGWGSLQWSRNSTRERKEQIEQWESARVLWSVKEIFSESIERWGDGSEEARSCVGARVIAIQGKREQVQGSGRP